MANKILFFDDEEFTTNNLVKNLRNNFNLDVTFVSTINKLFEELNNNEQYALIIMDVMVPLPQKNEEAVSFLDKEISQMSNGKGDGIKTGEVLVDKIRRNFKKYKDIPILFLTARAPFPLPGNAFYLRKPELAKTIVDEINKLLKSKQ